MEKIKIKIKNIFTNFKILLNKLPITIITILILTLFAVITYKIDINDKYNIIDKIYCFLSIFSVISLFLEVYLKDKKKEIKILGYSINIIVTLGFTIILSLDKNILGMNIEIVISTVSRILFGILSSLFILSIYKMYKFSQLKFNEYILSVFKGMLKIISFDIVLNIGISIIFFLFRELIYEHLSIEIFMKILILLQGGFFIPASILTFYNNKINKDSGFFKVLIVYILLPLYIILTSILYIYILKIIIIKQVPANFIYPVVAAIFVSGFIIYNLIKNYDDKKWIKVICNIIPYAFIPLIILQIYAVFVRYTNYGITPLRYISYMFLIFEISSIFFMIYKKGKMIEVLTYIMTGLILITTVTPFFNLVTISKWNQLKRLEKVSKIEVNNMTQEEIEVFNSAYKYLNLQTDSEKYITSYYKEKKTQINNMDSKNSNNTRKTIKYSNEEELVNVSEYSYFKEVSYKINQKNQTEAEYQVVLNFCKDILNKNSENVDISKHIKSNENIIKVDNNISIYISSITIYYYQNTQEIDYIYLSGYQLKK